MTYSLLSGLKIIEVSAFVAAPLAGLTLAHLGAEVIRIDPPGGGIDATRWPLAPDGSSLYWSGLNRAKKSICIDLKQAAGQEILHRLLAGNGFDGGVLLTNLTGPDWLSFDSLKQHRSDLVMVDLTGHHDRTPAVDYTVNAALGIPFATGPENTEGPVNHVLPAWDGIAGLTLATALLAAIRARDKTGQCQHLSVALSDVAMGFISNLGYIAEAELTQINRPRIGNHVYGTFGHSLRCQDQRYVMVVAITTRHWQALVRAAGIETEVTRLEQENSLDLNADADRYLAKDAIAQMLSEWSAQHSFNEITEYLDNCGALWGPYQSFCQLINEDSKASLSNPLFQQIHQSGAGSYRVAGSTIRMNNAEESAPANKSVPGKHTRQVLKENGLDNAEIDALIKQNIAKEQL